MRSSLYAFLLIALTGCTSAKDGGGGRDPRFDDLASQFEAERIALDASAASIAILEDGEVVWSEGFGTVLPDGGRAASDTTLYRIGSVNKVLTSTALLRQVDAGIVDLDDPVTAHVPDFHFDANGAWAGSIRVRHLLSHTSGMVDYLRIEGTDSDASLETFLTGNGLGGFGDIAYLMSPAGRMWNYSNPNFYVAGLVTEKADPGQAFYREIMRTQVFEPLGMDRTYFTPQEVLDDGDYATAMAYDWVDGSGQRESGPESYENAWARPAGYAWSSVLDLSRFLQFLLDGNTAVLSDALRAQMQEPLVNTEYFLDHSFYGHGLSVDEGFQLGSDWYEPRLVSHDGAIPGFSARVLLVPGTRFGLAILASGDGAYFPETVTAALRDFGGLPAPVALPDPQIVPSDFPKYAGTYEDPYNIGTIVIATSGSGVRISLPDVDAAGIPYDPDLIPYSKGNFVFGIQGFQTLATFIVDTAGNGQYFRTRFAVGERQPASFAPAQDVIVDGDRLRTSLRYSDGPRR